MGPRYGPQPKRLTGMDLIALQIRDAERDEQHAEDMRQLRATMTPGPARVLVVATIVVPGDQAMPLRDLEASIAHSFKEGGVHPVRVNCEFLDD